MSWLCCNQTPKRGTNIYPQPIKIKLAKLFNIFNPVVKLIVLPKKKQKYKFARQHLLFLEYEEYSHIPIVYFPVKNTENSLLLIYCHGSGSNLNNLYNFGASIMVRYGISVMLYDYTGDGESQKDFHNYQTDIKVVLAWAQRKGYSLSKIILCGYSIGSYSALLVPGQMARILISPICGIIPFIEGTTIQYEGQMFDNLENAQKIQARVLIAHGSDQMIPYNHSEALVDSLRIRNPIDNIQLFKVQGFNHLNMPNFLLQTKATSHIIDFLKKVKQDANHKEITKETSDLRSQLKKIAIKIKQVDGVFKTK